ncbi:DUF551 family protein [Planktothrix phage Pra-JY27]|nr:DUF551 domain-containing protein [Synechococcus phage MinM2]
MSDRETTDTYGHKCPTCGRWHPTQPACGVCAPEPLHPTTGWQPIETAPRDGRRLLAYGPTPSLSADYCIVRWASGFSAMHYAATGPGWYGEGHDRRLHPTHWTHLPEPPHA